MVFHARLHAELIGLLRQHSPFCDQRHLVLLAQMVAGLLLSQTVCFDRWKTVLPLGHCLAASWQRRAQRWLCNTHYGPLVLWALQHWQKPGQALHLALDTTMLWNRCCVVVLSVVCHGRAIPLLWRTLEHPRASASASVSIALLEKADRLLSEFGTITLLADRAFPSAELLGWFEGRPRWRYVMRLRADTWIQGTAAPMGCEVRRLRLPRGYCRGGSPLATRHELCADRPAVAATSRGQCRQVLPDLDADPTARAGTLHPQLWRAAPPAAALVHAD